MRKFNVFVDKTPYTVKADRYEHLHQVDLYNFYKDDALVASFPAHKTSVIDADVGDAADL